MKNSLNILVSQGLCGTPRKLLGACLMVLLLYVSVLSANAQSVGDYRSRQTGNWNTAESWQVYDGSSWNTAPSAPAASAVVTIQNGHTISLSFLQGLDFSGTLTIENGGKLQTGFISSFSIAAGGSVSVLSGGSLDITSGFWASPNLQNNGTLSIEGGTVICNDFTGSGTTTMTDGDLQVEGDFSPDAGAEVVISGGVVSSELVVSSGETISPAGSGVVGTLTVDGSVTLESGATYEVDIGAGTAADQIDVTGALTINGATLDIDFSQIDGAGRTIAKAASIEGNFLGLPDDTLVKGDGPDGPDPDYYIHYYASTPTDPNQAHITIDQNPPGGPTSSGIDLRSYQTEEGVVVEFVAYDVEEDGSIALHLLDADGNRAWSGSVDVTAGPRFFARFLVPGLQLGQAYDFRVRDEVGKWWNVADVMVESFSTEMTSATLAGITLTFDSLPDRAYDIQWLENLGDAWQTVQTVTASGDQTSVVVDYPAGTNSTGFFRVQLK